MVDVSSKTIASGLSSTEAERRLAEYGPNELPAAPPRSWWKLLAAQFRSALVLLLLAAAGGAALLGEHSDALAILCIVLLNSLLGARQEWRAERALEALQELAAPVARVVRDGTAMGVPARVLVPGDLLLLEAGASIPADGTLTESSGLQVQESALTGESAPVDKAANSDAGSPPADSAAQCQVFQGTQVVRGRGSALVVATGGQTQLGRIAALVSRSPREVTPLQRQLDVLGRRLLAACLVAVALVGTAQILRGASWGVVLLAAISLAVAAVPEGLPAAVTIALAFGSQRMLHRHALIRQLAAVETLGSVTAIGSDKTGTLTQNRMSVVSLRTARANWSGTPTGPAPPDTLLLAVAGALCTEATSTQAADPTEAALLEIAEALGWPKPELDQQFPRVADVPFDAVQKRMITVHRILTRSSLTDLLPQPWAAALHRTRHLVIMKGAPERVVECCDTILSSGTSLPFSADWRSWQQSAHQEMASKGLRVLGIACGLEGMDSLPPDRDRGLLFLGFVGMLDPPRSGVREAIQSCRDAGIRLLMITGDHPLTAHAIAQDLGWPASSRVVTGQELQELSAGSRKQVIEEASIYARVSPEQKLDIIEALKAAGHIVAMTGDGVNDAPALRRADIGVAMGLGGTDVAREASAMVLLDNNFSTIVAAIEEGRAIYSNLRKFVRFLLACNLGEIGVMFLGSFLAMPLPLLPIQLLWINLITDGLPALALALERSELHLMSRPPRPPQESIFARGLGKSVVLYGLLLAVVSLLAGYGKWREGSPEWQTELLTVLVFGQMAFALAMRTEVRSAGSLGFVRNRLLIAAVSSTLVLHLVVVYLPWCQQVFHTRSLSARSLLLSALLSAGLFWILEFFKPGEKA